jgi:hypothetical protein
MNSINDLINGNNLFVKKKSPKDSNFFNTLSKGQIYGWLFDIRTGFINDLNVSFNKTSPINKLFKIDCKTVTE